MPTFPLGQANDDRIHFNPATQSWERRSDDGGGEIEFSENTVQDLKALTLADGVLVGSLGIVLGTGNIYRAATATAVGSTWEPASGLYDVHDYGCPTDGTSSCNAAIAAAQADAGDGIVFFSKPITYLLTSAVSVSTNGQTLRGVSRNNSGTFVKMDDGTTTTTEVFNVSASRVTIEKMRLGYSTTVGIAAGADGIKVSAAIFTLNLFELQITSCNRAINVDGAGQLFSCTWIDVYIFGYVEYGIFNQPAQADTGNFLANIYITNTGLGTLRPTRAIDWGSSVRNSTWSQINVEHANFDASSPVKIQTVDGLEVNGLHFEEITLSSGTNGQALIEVSGSAVADFRSVNCEAINTDDSGTRYSIFFVNDFGAANHPQLTVGMITQRESNIGATDEFNIIYGRAGLDYASGWRCKIGHIQSDYAYDRVNGPGLDIAASEQNGIQEYDGRMYSFLHTFSDGDSTPSVLGWNLAQTANTAPTTISDLDDGYVGQKVTVLINDGNTTVDFTASGMRGNNGVDWMPGAGDFMVCTYDGTDWLCEVHEV